MRDRASQFIDAFDEIFRTKRMKILKTPVRTHVANAFAERWIGTLRRELLDRTIIWNRRQLSKLVVNYIDHYNTHRPHRSLDQRPPVATDPPDQPDSHLQVVRTAPLWRTHQRVPKCRLTRYDTVFGTHTTRIRTSAVSSLADLNNSSVRTRLPGPTPSTRWSIVAFDDIRGRCTVAELAVRSSCTTNSRSTAIALASMAADSQYSSQRCRAEQD